MLTISTGKTGNLDDDDDWVLWIDNDWEMIAISFANPC